MTRPRVPIRGFTLIEALAAIAVLAILIPVLLQGFTVSLRIAESTRQTADATALAQSTMDELIATDLWQNSSSQSNTETIGVTDYQWEADVNDWDQDANVEQLIVTVKWMGHGGVPNQLTLVSLAYYPGSATQSSNTLGPTLGGLP